MSDEKGCSVELHLRANIESGDLVEKEILCPGCGGLAAKFIGCGENGVSCAFLACTKCGACLAEFRTNAEMEEHLERIWNCAQDYLLCLSPRENRKHLAKSSEAAGVNSSV